LQAQAVPPCLFGVAGGCSVGSSFSFDFAQLFELQTLASIFNGIDDVEFTYTFDANGGGLPPGVTLSPSGLLSGTFTQSGLFSFNIDLTETLKFQGMEIFSETVPIPFEFNVTDYSGQLLTVAPGSLGFNLMQSGTASTQSLTVTNHGSQSAPFSASVSTGSGGNWLKIAPSAGSAPAFGSAAIAVTADPSQLQAGTYSGSVTVATAGSPSSTISVVAVVSGTQPTLELSQSGLRFQAVQGGGATSPQSITVLNPGAGTLNFTASVSTISGGSWLSVSPGSGSSTGSKAGSVTVSVNPAGLKPGDYYGRVQFAASGATNSPQVASVVLNVVSPANSPGAFVQPTGLIFVGNVGGSAPAAKTVSITNPSPNAVSYLVSAFGSNGANWLTATPTSGTVSAAQPGTLSVQPNLQGLAAGIYIGDLTVTIVPSDPTSTAPAQIFHIESLLVVLPAGVSPSAEPEAKLLPRVSTCAPAKLLPVFTLLGTGFSSTAGWPTAIEVTVVDDCGNPLTSGSVTVTFSSGDPALSLQSLDDGRWTATWNASKADPTVTITAQAQEIKPVLTGNASIGGALQPNNATPAVNTGGVVSAVSFVANQPLAPGAYAAIFGSNLSAGLAGSNQLPLNKQLGNTTVVMGGEQLPLLFASGGQINAVLPYDVAVNSTQQLVVQNGSAISIPQKVVIAPALPAIITQNQAGSGAALYAVFSSNGTPLPNNSAVSAGDVLVIYCSGLGAVDPPVPAGSQAPISPLSHTTNPVTVMFGQTAVQADFAGLAPGFAQLYQVNVKVPTGLTAPSATVMLAVSGQQSSPVTIAVK
jgi:uncharacterized protein (TIGR03437 family)